MNEIQEKFQQFTTTMRNKMEENEQEEAHVQSEVDSCRTKKTEIDSEMSLKMKERIQVKEDINITRKKITEVFSIYFKLT